MQFSTVVLALATAVVASAQAPAAASGACSPDHSSKFAISVVKPQGSAKRDLTKRAACGAGENSLTIGLKGGVLTDQNDRTGYIASNFQFQFDAPPQADHLQTSGFQVCGNNSLALNGNAVWYQCQSGSFYNLYNKNWAAQCKPVEIMAVDCSGDADANPTTGASGSAAPSAPASASAPAASAPAASATQISDGQPQAPSAAPSIATGAAAAYAPQALLAAAGFVGAAFL